jgi:hypothetical protein
MPIHPQRDIELKIELPVQGIYKGGLVTAESKTLTKKDQTYKIKRIILDRKPEFFNKSKIHKNSNAQSPCIVQRFTTYIVQTLH